MTSKGITISVTAETNPGCRRHMEDYLAVKLSPNEEHSALPHLREQAYIGVFDGHGGKEAAKCARERLWDIIQSQPKYRLSDITSVKESLEEAFLALHNEMEPLRATWKRNKTGDLSTAGTTATTIIFRQDHIFVANVGDSTAVLAVNNPLAVEPNQHPIKALVLTKDHKPEDPQEILNITDLGGKVMTSRKGVPRVVWRRPKKYEEGMFDSIPFLSVSRSLGDFWSYNPRTNHFTVSPKPDVHVHSLNPKEQRFIVIASDGLWNVMSPDEVVRYIWDYERNDDECHQPRDVVRAIINEALRRWDRKRLPADNIAVLIAFLTEANAPPLGSSLARSTTPITTVEAQDASKVSPSTETTDVTITVRESSPASPSLLAPKSSETECTAEVQESAHASPLLITPESSETEVIAAQESSPASPSLLTPESSETTAVLESSPKSSPMPFPESSESDVTVQESSPVPASPCLIDPVSLDTEVTGAVWKSSFMSPSHLAPVSNDDTEGSILEYESIIKAHQTDRTHETLLRSPLRSCSHINNTRSSLSPVGKHDRTEDPGDVPLLKRPKVVENGTLSEALVDDDSGVCSDDSLSQPLALCVSSLLGVKS